MKVKILEEAGYENALRGMAYSYKDRALNPDEWWLTQKEKAIKRSILLAPKNGGHNKFIRQLEIWVDIEACRAWWSEFDTYKVGTVAQSESTMHTLAKRPPEYTDFEDGTPIRMFHAFRQEWEYSKGNIMELKQSLPEGYLQRRVVKMNYDNVKNIIEQRLGHRFKWWDVFIKELLAQVHHPELLPNVQGE